MTEPPAGAARRREPVLSLRRAAEGLAGALAGLALRHPRRALAAWLLLTLLPLGGLARLRHDTDGQAMAPRGDPAIARDREIRALFGLRDQLLVFFDSGRPGGIFHPRLLEGLRRLSDQLAAFPELGRGHVSSLRSEPRCRLFAGWGETYRDFLTPPPRSEGELAALKEDLLHPSARLYGGTLVTADRGGAAISIGVPGHGELDRERLYHRVEALAAPWRGEGLRVDVVGAPAAEATLAAAILRDIALLIPLSILVIAAVLRLGTGRWAPVLVVLAKMAANLLFTFGLLGWLGWPIYLTVAIVPVVLAAMSLADEIHVFTRFQRALGERGDDRATAIGATYGELALPVLVATLTTCAGFLACLPSPIAPVQALGVAAAIGTFYSLFFTLTATPAVLILLPARLFAPRRPREARPPRRERFLPWVLRRRRGVLFGLAGLSLVAAAGASRLVVQDSWIDHFSRRDPLRQATERVNRRLFGVHRLEVRLAFPEPGALERPEVLAAVGRLEALLAARPDVGGVLGPYARLAAAADFWNLGDAFRHGDASRYLIPRFDFAPGRLRRQQFLADGSSQGLLTLFLKNANFRDTARVMAAVAAGHGELLAPFGGSFSFAGDVAVSQAMIPAVVRSQMLSLPLALVCVFLVVLLLCPSPRLALYAILPVAASGLWLLGGLGFLGIPLGVASSMFFVLALGLGVDSHSIHLAMRWREDGDPLAALLEVRRPILLNTLAVALGFGLLAFSEVPANRTLGLLISLGLLVGCLLTFTGLAALLGGGTNRAIGEKTAAGLSS